MVSISKFTIVIEESLEGGYVGHSPEIPGVEGRGETVDECRADLIQTITQWLDDQRQEDDVPG